MCLVLFGWDAHPRYRLVLAANRDEFHARPAEPAKFWDDAPDLLAGKDLQAGGTWMGITRTGRFAAITNYREPGAPERPLEFSRGHLVRDYLLGDAAPAAHAARLQEYGEAYRGYSLLLGDPEDLVCVSNRLDAPVRITAGIHALSNHLLDTPWPKAQFGRAALEQRLGKDRVAEDRVAEDRIAEGTVAEGRITEDRIAEARIDPDSLLELLADASLISGEEPPAFEGQLAPELVTRMLFIRSPEYGTRSSTVLLLSRDGTVQFVERQYNAEGISTGTERFEFELTG